MRSAAAAALALALALAGGVAAAARSDGAADAPVTGDPARGSAVWQDESCWSCHSFSRAGSSKRPAVSLDRYPRAHAAQLGLPLDRFVAGRIRYGGNGMQPKLGLTQQELADLTAFVVGAPVQLAEGDVQPVRPAPAPPPVTTAGAKTIAAWLRPRTSQAPAVKRGAALFAREGCLSCHRFAAGGRARFGAPDLTRALRGWTPARYAAFLRSPTLPGAAKMPVYGDLSAADLRALGAFLAASREQTRK